MVYWNFFINFFLLYFTFFYLNVFYLLGFNYQFSIFIFIFLNCFNYLLTLPFMMSIFLILHFPTIYFLRYKFINPVMSYKINDHYLKPPFILYM